MATGGDEAIKSGYLVKQGGKYRNWKKRYFVFKGTTITYFVKEGDAVERGTIDLTAGRGIRKKSHCALEWPKGAKNGLCFGLATEERTYYLYGTDKKEIEDWMDKIQKEIQKVGKPTDDWKNDPEGIPEAALSKAVRGATKFASQISKKAVQDSGLVDEETAGVIGSVADAAENQAEAGRDASLTDRLKMAAGDTAGIVGDNVDNEIVKTAANVAQEQAEADGDTSIQQRLLMAAGTTLEGASEMTDNEIASGVLSTAAGVAKDQADADEEDMSLKQRLVLAGGSALEGASEMVDNEIVAGAMEVAGGVVKGQAEDTSFKNRALMAIGSTADGVAGLDQFAFDSDVQRITKDVKEATEEMMSSSSSSSSSSSNEDEGN